MIAAKLNMHQEEPPGVQAPTLKVSESTVKDLAEVFKMLSDRNRLKIILALAEHGTLHVGALTKLVRQTQPAVSHHLTLMRIVGLVNYDRDGKNNYYYLASDYLRELIESYLHDSGKEYSTLDFGEFSLTYTPAEPS